MDLSSLPNLNPWQIIAILGVGWIGFRWLRARIREEQSSGYRSPAFHEAAKGAALAAMQTKEYRQHEQEIVAAAVSSSFEGLNKAITDHETRIRKVEGKVEGILGRLQMQRRHDTGEQKDPA